MNSLLALFSSWFSTLFSPWFSSWQAALHALLPPLLIALALLCAALAPVVARIDPRLAERVVRMDALPAPRWPAMATRLGAASLLGSFAVLLVACYLILGA